MEIANGLEGHGELLESHRGSSKNIRHTEVTEGRVTCLHRSSYSIKVFAAVERFAESYLIDDFTSQSVAVAVSLVLRQISIDTKFLKLANCSIFSHFIFFVKSEKRGNHFIRNFRLDDVSKWSKHHRAYRPLLLTLPSICARVSELVSLINLRYIVSYSSIIYKRGSYKLDPVKYFRLRFYRNVYFTSEAEE